MSGRQLADKWLKTEALLTDPKVVPYIPKTRMLSSENLNEMLSIYGMVVVKPVKGGGGHGVIRITKQGSYYSITARSRTYHYRDFNSMYQALLRLKVKRAYLIQQGIRLARISGRPLDYRVKVVKEGDRWTYRSMVGRLARRGLFVTNLCQGGTMLTCSQALRGSLPRISARAKRSEMRQLTNTCIQVLERHFPGISQLGFDYGIDHGGKIWILEVNTRPN